MNKKYASRCLFLHLKYQVLYSQRIKNNILGKAADIASLTLSFIGPLLSLIYMYDLPNCMSSGCPRMYAGDTNVTFAASNMVDLETQINNELSSINIWLN